MVRIRAKSILKLDTGQSQLDYEYSKNTPIDEVAKNIAHAVAYNKGVGVAREFFNKFLDGFDQDFGGSS